MPRMPRPRPFALESNYEFQSCFGSILGMVLMVGGTILVLGLVFELIKILIYLVAEFIKYFLSQINNIITWHIGVFLLEAIIICSFCLYKEANKPT